MVAGNPTPDQTGARGGLCHQGALRPSPMAPGEAAAGQAVPMAAPTEPLPPGACPARPPLGHGPRLGLPSQVPGSSRAREPSPRSGEGRALSPGNAPDVTEVRRSRASPQPPPQPAAVAACGLE